MEWIISISSLGLVLRSALLSLSKDARVSKDGHNEIMPAAILRDGRAKSAASSG
jgi:hypothetical protein